jgi:hypothetical protein
MRTETSPQPGATGAGRGAGAGVARVPHVAIATAASQRTT